MEFNEIRCRGGKRKGAGRPAGAKSTDEVRKNRTIKMTDAEYAKFKKIGGAKWMRKILDNGA